LKTPAHTCWTTVHQRRKNPAAVAYVLLAVLGALEQSKGGLAFRVRPTPAAGEGERVSDSILVPIGEREMAERRLVGTAHAQGDDGVGKAR
jgi:hypothetical protein